MQHIILPPLGAWYHILLPQFGYLVVGSDLDTISFEDHPMMHETLKGFKVLLHIYCTVGHLRGVRSPLYHLTASLRCAQKQAAFGTKKWQQFQNSTIVALDLWDLCANGILDQDDLIDLRTREVQESYFADSVMAHARGTLKYQRNNQEMVVKWKGELVDHMMAIDDHGKPTGLFVDQLVQNLDEVTGLFKGYSWKRYACGSQPRVAEHVRVDAAVASSSEASCVADHISLEDSSSACVVYACTLPGTHLDPFAPHFFMQ